MLKRSAPLARGVRRPAFAIAPCSPSFSALGCASLRRSRCSRKTSTPPAAPSGCSTAKATRHARPRFPRTRPTPSTAGSHVESAFVSRAVSRSSARSRANRSGTATCARLQAARGEGRDREARPPARVQARVGFGPGRERHIAARHPAASRALLAGDHRHLRLAHRTGEGGRRGDDQDGAPSGSAVAPGSPHTDRSRIAGEAEPVCERLYSAGVGRSRQCACNSRSVSRAAGTSSGGTNCQMT